MSTKGDVFVEALRALCIEHGIQLAVEGYDGLQIWPLQPGDDELAAPYIEDCLPDD